MHHVIDTITREGRPRRRFRSKGHNQMNSEIIKKSRAKAVETFNRHGAFHLLDEAMPLESL